MKRILTAMALCATLLLSGCDAAQMNHGVANKITQEMVKVCTGGVMYYFAYFDRGVVMAPVYLPDGGVELCQR